MNPHRIAGEVAADEKQPMNMNAWLEANWGGVVTILVVLFAIPLIFMLGTCAVYQIKDHGKDVACPKQAAEITIQAKPQ